MEQVAVAPKPVSSQWPGTSERKNAVPAITINPAKMSGAPTIAGTRTPVAALLDALSEGISLHEFIAEHEELTLADGEAALLALRDAVEELAIGTRVDF